MKKIIGFLAFLFIIAFVMNTLYHSGFFKHLEEHSELNDVSIYNSIAGPEDLEIDRENGKLFISSSDRWNPKHGKQSSDGIYLLNLRKNSEPFKLKTTYPGEFHPHGMSFLKKQGSDYLFVINHNKKGSFIELFKLENNILIHIKTFKSELMCCPNDLLAVDLNKFYVSNDHGNPKGFMRTLEDYLRIAMASILYFDGQKFSKVYKNLNYANGINISPDGKTIYVAETSGGTLSVLGRDLITGELKLHFTKNLKTGLDNITIDSTGNLWIASHPKLLDFVNHAKNNGKKSPSQVLKLSHKGNNDFNVTEIYLNKGEEISASSTALYYEGEIFIGVVFENKLLRGKY